MAADQQATVMLFAALRDAAGTGQVVVDAPVGLAELLADLATRFGEPFSHRVTIAAIMVDGNAVDRDEAVTIPPGAEVALLPPFAGGARSRG